MLADFAEADDVAQETFVRLWRSDLGGDEPRRVLAWIYRTSTRLTIYRMRERSMSALRSARRSRAAVAARSGMGSRGRGFARPGSSSFVDLPFLATRRRRALRARHVLRQDEASGTR